MPRPLGPGPRGSQRPQDLLLPPHLGPCSWSRRLQLLRSPLPRHRALPAHGRGSAKGGAPLPRRDRQAVPATEQCLPASLAPLCPPATATSPALPTAHQEVLTPIPPAASPDQSQRRPGPAPSQACGSSAGGGGKSTVGGHPGRGRSQTASPSIGVNSKAGTSLLWAKGMA